MQSGPEFKSQLGHFGLDMTALRKEGYPVIIKGLSPACWLLGVHWRCSITITISRSSFTRRVLLHQKPVPIVCVHDPVAYDIGK